MQKQGTPKLFGQASQLGVADSQFRRLGRYAIFDRPSSPCVLYLPTIYSAEQPIIDRSHEGNNGYMTNGTAPSWTQLPSGLWVLDFDVPADIVVFADTASLQLSTTFLTELWIKRRSVRAWSGIWGRRVSVNNVQLTFQADGIKLWFTGWTSGGEIILSEGLTDIEQDAWTHIVAGCDGTNAFTYINGVLDNSSAFSDTLLTTSIRTSLGAWTWYITPSDAQIALFRIYNPHPASLAPILQHYQQERHLFGV